MCNKEKKIHIELLFFLPSFLSLFHSSFLFFFLSVFQSFCISFFDYYFHTLLWHMVHPKRKSISGPYAFLFCTHFPVQNVFPMFLFTLPFAHQILNCFSPILTPCFDQLPCSVPFFSLSILYLWINSTTFALNFAAVPNSKMNYYFLPNPKII